MYLLPSGQAQFKVCSIRTQNPIGVQLVGQCTCRPNSWFLMRGKGRALEIAIDVVDMRSLELSIVRWDLLVAGLLNAHHKFIAIEKIELRLLPVVRPEGPKSDYRRRHAATR